MWPKLEKCLISLGSGKYFFNVCLNAYDNLNTLPQTVKPAKCDCVCGPVSTVPSSLKVILCSCQDYGFLQQYKEIHEIPE